MAVRTIESWQGISLSDVFYAYRKAKADCFFERSGCVAQRFVEYEQQLPGHLIDLTRRLNGSEIDALLNESLGAPRLVAKKLTTKPRSRVRGGNGHGFFSDPDRAFERLSRTSSLIPEFRLVGDFPVNMHVLSALWINLIGHKYDACLSTCAYGSRLRRYRPEAGTPPGSVGKYHIESIGSFQPYFGPYKAWRANGLTSIRRELKQERNVIAVTMDLTSYYHEIDPAFLVDPSFLESIGLTLSKWELEFTAAFVKVMKAWGAVAKGLLRELGCDVARAADGIPIGLSIARVVSNVLLIELDRAIEQGLAPVYYGRYVDDIFLVLRDPENLKTPDDLLAFISARAKCFPPKAAKDGSILLTLSDRYQGETRLLLQQQKQKVFFLSGRAGLDLLDNIESQIRSVSSERRLMPSPKRLESMASARVLAAAGDPTEEADTLRRADGLAVRRLGWSIQLRAVEILARDLRREDWKDERDKFYEFAHSHILRPDRILDQVDYLPRLLSIAVALADWAAAYRLLDAAVRSIKRLQIACKEGARVKINGVDGQAVGESLWEKLEQSVIEDARQAVMSSIPWSSKSGEPRALTEVARKLCDRLEIDPNSLEEDALAFREADWAKVPYKDHLQRDAKRERPYVVQEDDLYGLYEHEEDLRDFLVQSAKTHPYTGGQRIRHEARIPEQRPSLIPYLLPTRPYSTEEISLFLPDQCVFSSTMDEVPARRWARFVRAVRGVWVWNSLVSEESGENRDTPDGKLDKDQKLADLGSRGKQQPIRLGISSLLTTEDSWRAAASGGGDLSSERYERIETIVNEALRAKPQPTHLLLPELALPSRWIRTVSGLLRESRISLIAGLDYHHYKPKNEIYSEAVLVLEDDRLGFPTTVQIRQQKALPAPGEELDLKRYFGKEWPSALASSVKPIYKHRGFCFGVLVCSELQNIGHRQRFQGDVDCLMVLSWNKDLETFSSLVESASLDVHAYIALVNNRRYGDGRIRSPAKLHHARDLCRIRGGKNEHVVIEELDIDTLRAFQSRDTRWPSEDDPFKPVPEGFRIAPFRKTVAR